MNYISHVNGFLQKVAQDYRLNPTHISLYMALFQQWNLHRFRNPISIAREEVMATSHVHSRVTYHKCLRELHAWGFLRYVPSYNHYRGSLVYMLAFAVEEQGKQQQDIFCTGAVPEVNSSCTGVGQEVDPSINKINTLNHLNYLNGRARARIGDSNSRSEHESESSERKEKGCAEKEKKAVPTFSLPSQEEVRHFFQACGYLELEGQRFFHHYSANGWMVGIQPMQDWQAAAHKWVCNAFSQRDEAVSVKGCKEPRDYAEPL